MPCAIARILLGATLALPASVAASIYAGDCDVYAMARLAVATLASLF